MYVTAQRVLDVRTGHRGINAYKYLHGYDWDYQAPTQFLPDNNPGELADYHIGITPGGNRVVSYLDVVMPDEFDGGNASAYLSSLKHFVNASVAQQGVFIGKIWVRFVMSHDLRIDPATEMSALAGYILLRLFLKKLLGLQYRGTHASLTDPFRGVAKSALFWRFS